MWCSGDRARLPPMSPGFKSWNNKLNPLMTPGSFGGFFSGYSGFPPSTKMNISKFQFYLEFEGHGFVSRMNVMCYPQLVYLLLIYSSVSRQDEKIFSCDWLLKRARWRRLARSELPAVYREKSFNIKNALLTKLVRSR